MTPADHSSTMALAAAGIVAICCGRAWGIAISRWRRGRPAVTWSSRRPVPWSGVDILLFLTVFLAVALTLPRWIHPAAGSGEDELQPAFLMWFALSELLGCAVGAAVVAYSSAASWRDFGMRSGKGARDLALGLALFAALSVPVFSLQMLLSTLFEPTRHPLVRLLVDTRSEWAWGAGILTALVAAPVVEELFFRVLLQGWLEKLAVERPWSSAAAAVPATPSGIEPFGHAPLPTSPTEPQVTQPHPTRLAAAWGRPTPWWPMVVSAALFACAHWNHGPDPIPLFGLGLGLGYAYRQTHRVIPCVIVHVCVNLFSLVVIWLGQAG